MSNTEELLVQAISRQGGRPAGKSRVRFGTVNVGTISGKANEIVEMLTRRRVDLSRLQETRWRGGSARLIKGNNTIYKFFWSGDVINVISVKRYDHRSLQLRFLVRTTILYVIYCHASQSGLSADETDTFYERVFSVVASVPEKEMLVLGGDFNGLVGEHSAEFEGVHGGSGYGMRNQDGLRILDFCVAYKLAITNTFFHKNKSMVITFSSYGNHTKIDFILVRRAQLKNIKDTKVISSEECIIQHKLLVCDLVVSAKPVKPIRILPRTETWRLKDTVVPKEFEQAVSMKCQQMQKWRALGIYQKWTSRSCT